MNRKYVVFGSNDDGQTLVPLGIVEARTHTVAKALAKELNGTYATYGSATARNWSFQKEMTKTITAWVDVPMGQLRFDDIEPEPEPEDEKDEKDSLIAQAKDAIKGTDDDKEAVEQ